jgi:tRNA A-37 threonylcarbamoyl transferase component Bud32
MCPDGASFASIYERAWMPAARSAARLEYVASDEPGSMQHFTTALLLGDLLARLYATLLVSLVGRFNRPVELRHAFSLVRASGTGDWLASLADCEKRLRETELTPGIHRVAHWLAQAEQTSEELQGCAQALSDLAAQLGHQTPKNIKWKNFARATVFDLLVQIRNKTVHGAYDGEFYEDHVKVVDPAVRCLLAELPLWEVDLLHVTKATKGRVLQSPEPTHSAQIGAEFNKGDAVFRCEDDVWNAGPLLTIHERKVYLANGGWRQSGSSAEYLCHAVAATRAGQGTLRVTLPELARPPLPSVGQVVDGHYRITRVLGEGDDAVVFLACDVHEEVEYVLKAFREPSEAFDQRRTEFHVLRQIHHRNVPAVLEIHSWNDPFHLRLDYVAGAPLEAVWSDYLENLQGSLAIADAIAGALGAIHAVGYLHRDISPANILIPTNPTDAIRLIDFDLAAPINTVGLAGTSLYRPPESESGAPWDKSSDVYSLGVILYELLTGHLPYEPGDKAAEPRRVEPSTSQQEALGDVLTVLLKATAFEKRGRYRSAKAFLAAFRGASKAIAPTELA